MKNNCTLFCDVTLNNKNIFEMLPQVTTIVREFGKKKIKVRELDAKSISIYANIRDCMILEVTEMKTFKET